MHWLLILNNLIIYCIAVHGYGRCKSFGVTKFSAKRDADKEVDNKNLSISSYLSPTTSQRSACFFAAIQNPWIKYYITQTKIIKQI